MRRVILAAALLGSAPAARAAGAPLVRLDSPPPGWRDASSRVRLPGVILALEGPGSSSFVVARAPATAFDDAVAVRSFLESALEGLRRGSGLDYQARGPVKDMTFGNGLTAHLLRADLNGEPRLVVAAFSVAGRPLLATLSSAAPGTMLEPLLGKLRLEDSVRTSGEARSLDGQLAISLGGGLSSRRPTGEEIQRGAVLVVEASGAEVVFLRRAGAAAAPRQLALVRQAAAESLGVPIEKIAAPRLTPTAAGPEAVFAWAPRPGSSDGLAVGFLPWAYWGYSLLAQGPRADELLMGALAALRPGPDASPRLLAATPRLREANGGSKVWAALAALAALLLAAAFLLRRRDWKNR